MLSLLAICVQAQAQPKGEEKAIYDACMDYILAFYKADTSYAYRSVHPDLKKRGYSYSNDKKQYSSQLEMSFAELISLAQRWNKDGSRANDKTIKEVKVLDIADKTASAKITAAWGIDHVHLVKLDNKWYVMNVLWQTPPRAGL